MILSKEHDAVRDRYRAAREAAIEARRQVIAKLAEVAREREHLTVTLQNLNKTIAALKPLCDMEAEENFRDLCYRVLLSLGRKATVPEIAQHVGKQYDLSQFPNALAVIHVNLQRMPDRVRHFKESNGNRYYVALPPPLGPVGPVGGPSGYTQG